MGHDKSHMLPQFSNNMTRIAYSIPMATGTQTGRAKGPGGSCFTGELGTELASMSEAQKYARQETQLDKQAATSPPDVFAPNTVPVDELLLKYV